MKKLILFLTALSLSQAVPGAPLTVTILPNDYYSVDQTPTGGSATFSTTVTGGTPPYTYQWRFVNRYATVDVNGINHYNPFGPAPGPADILPNHYVTTVAGQIYSTPDNPFQGDHAHASVAHLAQPEGISVDAHNNLYIV